MMQKLGNFVIPHITYWGKAWFGLIFLGSIFNKLAKSSSHLLLIPSISFWCFALGATIGLLAIYRGRWL